MERSMLCWRLSFTQLLGLLLALSFVVVFTFCADGSNANKGFRRDRGRAAADQDRRRTLRKYVTYVINSKLQKRDSHSSTSYNSVV